MAASVGPFIGPARFVLQTLFATILQTLGRIRFFVDGPSVSRYRLFMLIAIDPGLHHCGVSVWRGGKLIEALLVHNTVQMPGPLNAQPMARAVAAEVPLCDCDLVIEVPQVYPHGRGKGNPNDLIDLAAVAGACMGLAGGGVTYYLPAQWKGQVPKEICHARMMEALTDVEKCAIRLCRPAGLLHNVYDAVALGLAHLRKVGVRR